MATKKNKMVIGVFRDPVDADRAFDGLLELGHTDTDVNVLMSDETHRTIYLSDEDRPKKHKAGSMAAEGMGVGGALGSIGGAIAALAAVGASVVLPGFALMGPIAVALAGAGAGAATGGLLGALIGYGIPEQNAQAYEDVLRDGGVVIGVTPRDGDDADNVENLFKECNGENVVRT